MLARFPDGASLVPIFRKKLLAARRAHQRAHLGLKLAAAKLELYVLRRMRDLVMTNASGVEPLTFCLIHEGLETAMQGVMSLEDSLREAEAHP